jgi:hypothetical protein
VKEKTMTNITITEALAEIKTIGARIGKKREFINGYLARQDGVKDPLESDGGSVEVIKRERQAVQDLEARIVALRRGISRANEATLITVAGETKSIADWLTWRRDVAPGRRTWLAEVMSKLRALRDNAKREGLAVVTMGDRSVASPASPSDFVINISEAELAREIEQLADVIGTLDGQLSLKNATVPIQDYIAQA